MDDIFGDSYDMSMYRKYNLRLMGRSASELPDYHRCIPAAPLVQIFSVFVSTEFDECQIYGHIRATELKDGTSFYLYNRDPSEYETISKAGALSLTGPDGDAILGNTRVTIDVCLKDLTRNIDLINGQCHLDCVRDESRDKLMKAVIDGQHSSVSFYYTIFRFAVYAVVGVAICKNTVQTDGVDEIYGSLVASYSNSRQYSASDDEVKYLETKLFEKPFDKPMRVANRMPIKLLRYAVAGPAYGSLLIKVELSSSNGHLASGFVEFPVQGDYCKTISFGNDYVEVKVEWETAYPRMYTESVIQRKRPTGSDSDTEEPLRNIPLQLELSNFTSLADELSSNLNGKSDIKGCSGVEIFTVYIGGINHEVSTLYGSIQVNGGYNGYFEIYYRSRSEAEPLLDDNTVCLELCEDITNCNINIVLDLRERLDLNDPNQDLEICWSEIGWCYGMTDGFHGLLWNDKRVCFLARGASGYASLHFLIIENAVRATLEVSLICDLLADVPPNVYGLIRARYGGHEYSTDYEKLYYKSILFNKQRPNPWEPSASDLKVPLIKTVMLVPSNSYLIIEADLNVICQGNTHEEIVFGEQDFAIDISETIHKDIGKGSFRIKVSVTYSDPSG